MATNAFIALEDGNVGLIENGVPVSEQTMTAEKCFWAFFSPNICTTAWLFGVIAAAGQGFYPAFIAIVLGNIFGALPTAFAATMGPQTRLSSLESSRFALGRQGVRLPALLNWLNSIGWDALNNVPCAAALAAFGALYGWKAPFWAALLLLSVAQMIIAIYGHHLVQIISKYLGWVLLALFVFLGLRVSINIGGLPHDLTTFSLGSFVLAFSLAASNTAGYAPYAADYTRYLPATTRKRSIALRVFLGLTLSCILMQTFGLLTAAVIQDHTPEGFIASLQGLAGSLAPLVLLVAGISSIPGNAINDSSSAYCLVSAGVRIPRPVSATIAAALGFGLALYGSGNILTVVENVILLLFYWIAPWTSVVLVHWLMSHQKETHADKGWTAGATIFLSVTVVTMALFTANDLYTGPIAKALGGVDIGYYVGFFAAGGIYAAWLKLMPAKI